MKSLKHLIVFVVFISSYSLNAQVITEDFKSLPTPYSSNAGCAYGQSVAIDGDYAVIGAPWYNGELGSAYVLFNNGTTWETVAFLTASDGSESDLFGNSVAISGDVIIIGAYGDEEKTGSAYVFEKPLSGWTDMNETAKLTASDGTQEHQFGNSVDISGDVIVIGADRDNGNGFRSGAAYVFKKPTNGWTNMTETAKLSASDGISYAYFGSSVSIFNDVIVVGSILQNTNGEAYIFERPSTGWEDMTQTAKLTASDASNINSFGYSVCMYIPGCYCCGNKYFRYRVCL